jgi:hypothetical protein
MINTISNNSIDRLSLAKEMFSIGKILAEKNTKTGLMLSIMNFDFAVTSIIITCCIENGLNTKNERGKVKEWKELLDAFKKIYVDISMVADLEALHMLRNSIQHGDTIPSNIDIERFEKVVKSFFDDICKTVYSRQITYDKISMAKLMKSYHEMELMEYIEEFIESKKFELAMYLIQTLALYHYTLVKTNLVYPEIPTQMFSLDHNIGGSLNDIFRNMNNLADRLAFGKHLSQLKQILEFPNHNKLFDTYKMFPYEWIQTLEPKSISYDQVEKYRILLYDVISGTEYHLVDKLIVDAPLVYGSYFYQIKQDTVIIKFGVLSKLEIEECIIKLYQNDIELRSYLHDVEKGYNEFVIDKINQKGEYTCTITVTQKLDPDLNSRSYNYSILKISVK